MWQTYPVGNRTYGWIELSENGWGAIVSWFAGPDNVRREPMAERCARLRVTCELAGSTTQSWTEAITTADVQEIEDDIDDYLRDSKLPARPRGYRWFTRLPDRIRTEQDFWGRLVEADLRMPHANRDLVQEATNLGATIQGMFASDQ